MSEPHSSPIDIPSSSSPSTSSPSSSPSSPQRPFAYSYQLEGEANNSQCIPISTSSSSSPPRNHFRASDLLESVGASPDEGRFHFECRAEEGDGLQLVREDPSWAEFKSDMAARPSSRDSDVKKSHMFLSVSQTACLVSPSPPPPTSAPSLRRRSASPPGLIDRAVQQQDEIRPTSDDLT